MKPQDILIDFMMAKQVKLGSEANYFTSHDIRAIEQWDDEKADKVLQDMKKHVNFPELHLLGPAACPFCYYHGWFKSDDDEVCSNCEYAETHGKCPSSSSDYNKARIIADRYGLKVGDLIHKLNQDYKESKPQEPQTLKLWSERQENDHPRQVYLFLRSEIGSSILSLCKKDGRIILGSNILGLDLEKGTLTLYRSINDPSGILSLNENRQIKVEGL
jgi:hypothetical protein